MAKSSINLAREAKDQAIVLLSGIPGVVGVGITKVDNDYAIKVNLESALPKNTKAPKEIDGVPVIYEVVGRIKAQ